MNGKPPNVSVPDSWAGRKHVTSALYELANDFEARSETWENTTVPDFLEGFCFLLMSIENSYVNLGRPIPEDPWAVIADALRGARYYE